MDSSTGRLRQEYGPSGILYDLGSVYAGLLNLTDVRKAKGKIYRLETILMIIVLAKLCGEDTPYAIADWAHNHGEQLVELLQLPRPNMPSHHTLRRIMARRHLSGRDREVGGKIQSGWPTRGRLRHGRKGAAGHPQER